LEYRRKKYIVNADIGRLTSGTKRARSPSYYSEDETLDAVAEEEEEEEEETDGDEPRDKAAMELARGVGSCMTDHSSSSSTVCRPATWIVPGGGRLVLSMLGTREYD